MENISWTDRVKNEVLSRVKEERKILYAVNKRMANRTGCIFCRILPSKTWY